MLFTHLKEQKAFTAFLSTLIFVSTFSAALLAKPADAATEAFQDVQFVLDDARVSHNSGLAVYFAPGNNGFTTEGSSTTLMLGSPTATTTVRITMTGVTSAGISTSDVSLSDGFSDVGSQAGCGAGPNNNAILPEAYVSSVIASPLTIDVTLCANNFLFSDSQVGFPKVVLQNGQEVTLPAGVGSYDARVLSLTSDASANTFDTRTKYAVVNTIAMTGNVDPLLTFSVTGVGSGVVIGSDTTTRTSTATSTPMGTLASGTPAIIAQKVSLSTNAAAGASVSVQATTPFQSANGAIIDGLNDGTNVLNDSSWSLGSLDVNNDLTWGMIGVRSSNMIGTSMGAGNYSGTPFGSRTTGTAAMQLFSYNQPIPSNVASSSVVYKAQVSDLQEAATDYKTELIYTVTPTF